MAPAMRPQSQDASPTCLAVSNDQPLGVQEFLGSLKKSRRRLSTPKRLEAPQAKTFTSCQLTVQEFLHDLRKPVAPPCKDAEAAEGPKLQPTASTDHEDFPCVDSAAIPGSAPLDPPDSTPNEIDYEQILTLPSKAKILRSPKPKGADEKDASMKIPKVVWTYSKKIKHVSPSWKDSSTLSQTQSSTHEGALLDGLLDDGLDTPTKQLATREIPRTKSAKTHTLATSRKRKWQPLQGDEYIRQKEHSDDDADMIRENKTKTKRKKRRAPVNGLPLVETSPSHRASDGNAQIRTSFGQHLVWVPLRQCAQSTANLTEQKAYDLDYAIDLLNEYVDDQGFPASTSPNCDRSRKSMRANVGKPVTRIRHGTIIQQREVLAREGFKLPPITPRAKRSPGWRLGSGFDGITLEPSTNKISQTLRIRKVRHAGTPCLLGWSLPKLVLSARLSSTGESVGQRSVPERQKDQGSPIETRTSKLARNLGTPDGAVEFGLPLRAAKTGGKAAFEQVAGLTALLRPQIDNDKSRTSSSSHCKVIAKELTQLYLSQNRDPNASQAVRGPSKSERNGWLKRRRVGFTIAAENEEEQLLVHTQRTSVNASGHGTVYGRNGLDTYLNDTAQRQHAIDSDLQGFDRDGQTTSKSGRPIPSQQQDGFQDKQSAEQHRRQVLHDAEEQDSDSEEEVLGHQSSNSPPEPPPSSDPEADFPTSPLHSKGSSMFKARHHIEVPRTSKVPETQERLKESIELNQKRTEFLGMGTYCIPATTLDSGKCSSKAIQQLESPEKALHIVTRRRSRREPHQHVRGSQVTFGTQKRAHHVHVAPIISEQESHEGSLMLGVTPRLERRTSNVPFRPPFKEPL